MRIDVAFDEGGQIVKSEFDAVIGDAVLREIVGADSFVAFAGADLGFALRGVFGVFFGDFALRASASAGPSSRELYSFAGER